MSNASVSEQILALLSSRERASEVVGDLLEQGLTGGVFRAAILRVAFRLLLRWVAGLWSALACSISVVALYCLYVVPKWKLPQHETWVVWSVRGAGASFCLATVVGLAASHYGIRDRLTRMSVLVWLSITASTCLAWLPHAAYAIVPVLLLESVIAWWRLSHAVCSLVYSRPQQLLLPARAWFICSPD